ncbi:MAG: hypothetical protein IPM64_17205 [Phycisphaerales bacterium]|nr:hypothetical protein [Phycisphaerales bacterium]
MIAFSTQSAVTFDATTLDRRWGIATERALVHAGAVIRKIARNSIKPAPLRGTLMVIDGRAVRGEAPRRSAPGKPPYSQIETKRRAALRAAMKAKRNNPNAPAPVAATGGWEGLRHIVFHYDKATRELVVGPISRTGGKVTQTMEFGGTVSIVSQGKQVSVRVAARPFMAPALDAAGPIERYFRGRMHG